MKALRWIDRHYRRLWHRETQWAEMVIALFMFARGVIWLSPWGDMSNRIYGSMSALMGATGWGALFALAGGLMVSMLMLNGDYKWTPHARAGLLIVAFALNMLLVLTFLGTPGGAAAQGIGTAFVLTAASVWCALRVATTART